MAIFVKHEGCPRCGSRDNLGRYDDGSAWCFGCHYREPPTHVRQFRTKEIRDVSVPTDLGNDFPGHVVDWLAQYGITIPEAIKHGWKYSPHYDQLVFSWRDENGQLLLAQARNFRPGAKKYFNSGSPADVLPIFRSGRDVQLQERTLAVVEDAVSAAKISRQCDAMPCLGSYLPAAKLARLRPFYERLIIWLDSDKLKEAMEISTKAKWLGIATKVVHTELDPKEYSDAAIANQLHR